MWNLILYTFLVGVIGTGLGGVVGALFKKDSNRTMSLLLSFAGGIMLSIVCFDLLTESIQKGNIYITIIVTIIGIAIVYLLNHLIDKRTEQKVNHRKNDHPKTHDDLDELMHSDTLMQSVKQEESRKEMLNAGLIMVLAIALHNLPEGLSIGSSYIHNNNTGILLSIIIAFHNIPEGMAIVAPLISGGMQKSKAILATALSGAPTVIGGIIGYIIGGASDIGIAISLALASGAMLYVVFGEIFPQSILMYKSKLPAFFAIFGLLLGLFLLEIMTLL